LFEFVIGNGFGAVIFGSEGFCVFEGFVDEMNQFGVDFELLIGVVIGQQFVG
jgi:hypothetical protein